MENEYKVAVEFAEWLPDSGFTQIAKRLGGYWFQKDDAKRYTTSDVFKLFLAITKRELSCEIHGHDIIPILGFENSIIGEECRQCGEQL